MPPSEPDELAFAIRGPITREDLPGLCERVRRLLGDHPPPVVSCDVHDVVPDAVVVDALARLELAARRRRCEVRLERAPDELLDLVRLLGLENVIAAKRSFHERDVV